MTPVASSGFDVKARWRLLSNVEDTEEIVNENPALLDPLEAKDKRFRRGNSADDANMKDRRVTAVIKNILRNLYVTNLLPWHCNLLRSIPRIQTLN